MHPFTNSIRAGVRVRGVFGGYDLELEITDEPSPVGTDAEWLGKVVAHQDKIDYGEAKFFIKPREIAQIFVVDRTFSSGGTIGHWEEYNYESDVKDALLDDIDSFLRSLWWTTSGNGDTMMEFMNRINVVLHGRALEQTPSGQPWTNKEKIQ